MNYDDIENSIRKVSGTLLKDISLFDLYEGVGIEKNQHSLALSFTFKSEQRTLVDGDVDDIMKAIINTLKDKYNMRVLTATWSPHLYTDIGFINFTDMIHEGGLDNILMTPNGQLHSRLTKASFLDTMPNGIGRVFVLSIALSISSSNHIFIEAEDPAPIAIATIIKM